MALTEGEDQSWKIACSFRLTYLPWMTLTLIGGLWVIHLWTMLFGSHQNVREAYGLAFDDLFSYVTHALIHDVGLYHVVSNTLPLLLLGSCLEAQIGRRWYGVATVLSILAGVAGVFTFLTVTGLSSDEKGHWIQCRDKCPDNYGTRSDHLPMARTLGESDLRSDADSTPGPAHDHAECIVEG